MISSQSFLQGDAIIIDGHDLAFSKYSNKFVISLQYLKKEVRDGVHFCMQINIKVFTKWHYLSWWKWPDMSNVPKIGKLQYFWNTLRKKCLLCSIVIRSKTFRYFAVVQTCSFFLVFSKEDRKHHIHRKWFPFDVKLKASFEFLKTFQNAHFTTSNEDLY